MKVKVWHITMVLVLLAGILAGCGGEAAVPINGAAEGEISAVSAESGSSEVGAVLDASSENALPVGSQLALGTFLLAGTEEAVTPEQAKALLPLWQTIQSGALQSDAETNAVLKQIEGAMTAEQLAAIAAMQLTFEDMETWAQERGLSLAPSPEAGAPDRAAGGGKGEPGANLSEEERAARRATAEAGGMTPGGRQAGAGGGQLTILAEPLVELLTRRAAE